MFFANAAETEINTTDGAVTIELPINWTRAPEYNLEVHIPKGFTALQPLDEWEKATLIEFVPSGQNGDNWSEIISVSKLINQKIRADKFIQKLKEGILAKATNGSVFMEEETTRIFSYVQSRLILSYDYEGKHEVMGALYYSGPYDCAGVQYTIRQEKIPDQNAIEKITHFFDTATKVTQQSRVK